MILDAAYYIQTVTYGGAISFAFPNLSPLISVAGSPYVPYFLPGARPRLLKFFLQGYPQGYAPIGSSNAAGNTGTWINPRWSDGSGTEVIKELSGYPTGNVALPIYLDEAGNADFNLPFFKPMNTPNNFFMQIDTNFYFAAGITAILDLSVIARFEVATDSVILL